MSSLTEQEIVRYSRHIILPEVGGRGQKKLKGASVLLAGLGAAGSAAALYLAAAGIGRITLWDPALVTPQDLEGGIAHDRSRLGTPRSRSAAVPLRAINPDSEVAVLDRENDVAGAMPDYQVALLSGGDWLDLEPAALKAGASAVLYAAHGARGAVTVARPEGPCLDCLGGVRAQALGLYPEEGGAAAVAAAAGVVGVVAATEAIKLIVGTGSPLTGRVLRYDGWLARFDEDFFERVPGCPVCHG
jgi:molybdopterin/thiamine biosynthesis adenylyltransferase